MHGRLVGGCALLVVILAGCVDTSSPESFTNRAIRADIRNQLIPICPREVYRDFCSNERETSEECLKRCADASRQRDLREAEEE